MPPKEAQLVTTIIRDRLSSLGISLAPVASDKTAPDVLLIARTASYSTNRDVVRVLAHSTVLKRECDYFREWFTHHHLRTAPEQQQRVVVKQMVHQALTNVHEEHALQNAITTLVDGVMKNVVAEQKRLQEEDDELFDRPKPPPPPPEPEVPETPAEPDRTAAEETKREQAPEIKPMEIELEEEELPKYTVIEKLDWTAPVLYAILEWIYTRCCHIDLDQLSEVYEAAEKMIYPSLMGAIRDYNNPEYLRYALERDEDRKALIRLCSKCRCDELAGLKMLCTSLRTVPVSRSFCILLESAGIAYRHPNWLPEGLFTLSGHPVCSLREPQSQEPLKPYLTLYRETGVLKRKKISSPMRRKSFYESPEAAPQMRKSAWRIIDLGGNPARCCFRLFRFAAETSFDSARRAGMYIKPVIRESFTLRMVTGSMVSSIIKGALGKAIDRAELKIKEERGSGYYIRGPSYCFSLLLQGDPSMILVGAKAIPQDMVGRAAFRIRNPSERTFARFLPAMRSFGVDFEANTLYLIKPLSSIIRILEFVVGVSREAYTPLEFERQVVEVVEATDPF